MAIAPGRAPSSRFPNIELATVVTRAKSTAPFLGAAGAGNAWTMATVRRVGAIDFWRGAILVVILVDHISGNLLDRVTPRNFGLSDSAEAFVFLSGLSVGLVYHRRTANGGFPEVVRSCLARAFRIYGVHIAITFCAVAIFGAFYALSGLPGFIEEHGRAFVFHSPLHGALGVLALTQQLGYFNILPMYVVFMLLSPAILVLADASAPLALAASAGVYAATRLGGLQLPNWPESGTWFFNPFAWQLVFTLGIVAAIVWREGKLPDSKWLFWISAFVVFAGAAIVTDGAGTIAGLRDFSFARLDIQKQNLGLGRLLHFVALAYLIAKTPILARLAETFAGREIQRLGRHSLAVFAFGSLLGALGQAVLRIAAEHLSIEVGILGMSYTTLAATSLFVLARRLEHAFSSSSGDSSPKVHGLSGGAPRDRRLDIRRAYTRRSA